MTTYTHVTDFPPNTRWAQLSDSAIAVTPDGRVFRVAGGIVEELQAQLTKAKASVEDEGVAKPADASALKAEGG